MAPDIVDQAGILQAPRRHGDALAAFAQHVGDEREEAIQLRLCQPAGTRWFGVQFDWTPHGV
jgi:hypothetical protein